MKIKKNANQECVNAADCIEVFKPRKDKERLSDSDSDEAEAQTRRPGSSDPPSHSPSSITLLSYHEAPIHLRFNPYILSGYRGYLSTKMCIESIFWMTNETINIWSHIFGWMLFLALTMYDLFLLNLQASVFDKFIVGLLLCCFQICMVTSTLYHVFSCKSERHFHNFLCFDLFGIALSLLAIYLTGVYYAFWCHKEWQYFYLATVFVIFIACMIMQIPRLNVDPNIKMLVFVCWAAYGVVPTVHWAIIMGAGRTPLSICCSRVSWVCTVSPVLLSSSTLPAFPNVSSREKSTSSAHLTSGGISSWFSPSTIGITQGSNISSTE
ncbi:hypothetical protein WDU94_011367 [Cyamophila willieti]